MYAPRMGVVELGATGEGVEALGVVGWMKEGGSQPPPPLPPCLLYPLAGSKQHALGGVSWWVQGGALAARRASPAVTAAPRTTACAQQWWALAACQRWRLPASSVGIPFTSPYWQYPTAAHPQISAPPTSRPRRAAQPPSRSPPVPRSRKLSGAVHPQELSRGHRLAGSCPLLPRLPSSSCPPPCWSYSGGACKRQPPQSILVPPSSPLLPPCRPSRLAPPYACTRRGSVPVAACNASQLGLWFRGAGRGGECAYPGRLVPRGQRCKVQPPPGAPPV